MLKRFIFAAGTLLVATTGLNGSAAAANRAYYGYRNLANHSFYPRRAPVASPRRVYAQRTRFAWRQGRLERTYLRPQHVRPQQYVHTVRRFFPAQAGHVAFRRPAYSRRFAVHNFRVATARRDSAIRNYVGPRSAYTPVTGGTQVGGASYYGGGRTASGGFVGAATCAHRTLPFGTRVLVTNLANARQAVLTVNDRGPFIAGRIVDVSTGAASVLGMLHSGTAPVRVQVVGGRS